MLLPSFPELGWALCPTVPPSTEVSFPNRLTFPLPLGVGPPSTGTSVRISLSGQPGLGEAYPLRPAHPSPSWDSAARPACLASARAVQRGPRNTGEESAGCRHGHVRETREVISSPPPLFPARHGLGTRWRVQFPETSPRVSPRASPGLSPRPGRLCKPPSREGNAPRAPRRGLAPTPPGRAAGLVGTHRGLHGGAGCAGGRRAAGRAPVRGAGPAAAASFALRPLHPSATRRWAEQGRGGGAGPRSAGTMTRGAGRSLSRLPGPHPAGDFALRGREGWPRIHACVSRG